MSCSKVWTCALSGVFKDAEEKKDSKKGENCAVEEKETTEIDLGNGKLWIDFEFDWKVWELWETNCYEKTERDG